jgi:hypothetical protein
MSKILNRIQSLRDKANQLKQAVDSAPAKAAQLRDAVNATAGQLQLLKADVQGTVASLHADTDTSLAETLVELDRGASTLERAGYELTGVDIEQGQSSRVIVHLDQMAAARTTSLEKLITESVGNRILSAILHALVRAEQLEEQVSVGDLTFRGLIIHVGPVPVVRICWRRPGRSIETESEPTLVVPPPVIASPTPPPLLPGFGGPSIYDVPKPTVSATEPDPLPPVLASGTESKLVVEPSSAMSPAIVLPSPSLVPTPMRSSIRLSPSPIFRTESAKKDSSDSAAPGSADPLARFKQMPKLTK